MLITTKGQMVRTRVKEIRAVGRNTMGVKLMDLRNGEKLQAIAPVVSQAEEEAQIAEAPVETAVRRAFTPAGSKGRAVDSTRRKEHRPTVFPSVVAGAQLSNHRSDA